MACRKICPGGFYVRATRCAPVTGFLCPSLRANWVHGQEGGRSSDNRRPGGPGYQPGQALFLARRQTDQARGGPVLPVRRGGAGGWCAGSADLVEALRKRCGGGAVLSEA